MIRRRLLSALHRQTRRAGPISLETRIPREQRDEDGIPLTLADTLASNELSPYDLAAQRDEIKHILNQLAEDDRKLITAIAHGHTYAEAGAALNIDAKAIDNHIQRIRRAALKLRAAA